MTTTVANIRDLAQLALSDAGGAVWADATVEAWVVEAMRDYASHFKRLATKTVSLATGQAQYNLPYDCLEIITVEYPRNQDPPDYLDLLTRKDPRFWAGDTFYDFEPSFQEESEMVGVSPPLLWLSATVATGESVDVTYYSNYYSTTDCGIPDHHIPLLILFVQWKAAVERLNSELQGPDYSNIIVGHIRGAVQQAREAYERALNKAIASASRARWTEPWALDDYDRIY